MLAAFRGFFRVFVDNIDNLIEMLLPAVKQIFVTTLQNWPWIAFAALLVFVGLLAYRR